MASLCQQLESEAKTRNLPPAFFTRLIWTESRFNPNAVSHMNARGIAQFIPATARRRGLKNPFNVRQSLKASAWFLSDLRNEFGNVGLAAAAYNAGEGRIRNWIAGRSGLPRETTNYVYAITGIPAREWKQQRNKKFNLSLDRKRSFQQACQRMRAYRFSSPRMARRLPSSRRKGRRGHRRRRHVVRRQPWGVHLAEHFSRHQAMRRYGKIRKRFARVLKGRTPMVLRQRNPSFGRRVRYSVVMGSPTRGKAQKLCKQMRRAGGLCLVVKN